MTYFLVAEDNPRVLGAAGDQEINKIGGLIAGVILMVLFTYVISVFVVHGIEQESSVIGALYALGVTAALHYTSGCCFSRIFRDRRTDRFQ